MISEDLKHTIAAVMDAELQRQADSGANRIDLDAMAGAVAAVLDEDRPSFDHLDEGRRPEDLNSNNDG